MTFKEQLREDVQSVFLNTDEFAALHDVNGKKIPTLVDSNELIERGKSSGTVPTEGISAKMTLIYVRARDYGVLPPVGTPVRLDGSAYRVVDAINEDGLYSIHLQMLRS